MKYYSVILDREPLKSYKKFHEDFVSHPKINKWWHYIKSMYIVGTDLSAKELSDHLTECLKANRLKIRHLVLKIDLEDRQGRLPDDAWEWIKKNS